MRFAEIRSIELRRIRGYLRRAQGYNSKRQLIDQFIREFTAVVSADYICWHAFSADFSALQNYWVNFGYKDAIDSRIEAFGETVGAHPILNGVGFEGLWDRPCRLSDFAGDVVFQTNPLYDEVYRHLDSRYQLMFHVATVGDQAIAFTVNRWLSDFTDAERQKMHCLSIGLRCLLIALHERERMESRLQSLAEALEQGMGIVGLETLTKSEVSAVGEISRVPSLRAAAERSRISTDTFKERMSSVRAKLGMENTKQLRAALYELSKKGANAIHTSGRG